MRHEHLPLVHLTDLVPDGCNFKDQRFLQEVRDFMSKDMPAVHLSLLADSEGNHDHEEWDRERVSGLGRFVVESTTHSVCTQCECMTEDPECCGLDDDCDGPTCTCEERFAPLEQREFFRIRDTDYLDQHVGSAVLPRDLGVMYDYMHDDVYLWEDEDEATTTADGLTIEAEHEGMYGFPFACSWARMPSDRIRTEDLIKAGFLVYTFRNTRIAGIDGGGYSFEGQHFAKLYALHAERCEWSIMTDQCEARITTAPRPEPEPEPEPTHLGPADMWARALGTHPDFVWWHREVDTGRWHKGTPPEHVTFRSHKKDPAWSPWVCDLPLKVKPVEYRVCNMCTVGIANNDWSSLDTYLEEKADALMVRVTAWMTHVGWLTHLRHIDTYLDESTDFTCPCCGEHYYEETVPSAIFEGLHPVGEFGGDQ